MGGMGTPRTVSQAIKGRLYPSREQAATLSKMRFLLACIRERVRAESREYYEREEKGCSVGWLQKEVAQPMHRRLGMPCDALSVVNVVAMHHQALRNWWRRPDHYDAPSKRAPERYPVNPYVHNQRLEVADGRVRLFGKKVGWMRWRAGRQPSGRIMSGRVSFRGGHWHLAIQFDGPAPEYAQPTALAVGVDPGIRAMTAHDGERSMEFRRVPERSKSRRRRLARKLSRAGWRCGNSECAALPRVAALTGTAMARLRSERRRKAPCGCWLGQYRPSARRRQLMATIARQREHEANVRRDRSHKATRKLIDHARVIGYEDPSAKAWQESKMFGEASREAAAGEFCRQLRYKGGWAGRDVVPVPESEASTQTCYVCGERTRHALGVKVYRCGSCGHTNKRDENSALNVRRKAIEGARAALPEAVA